MTREGVNQWAFETDMPYFRSLNAAKLANVPITKSLSDFLVHFCGLLTCGDDSRGPDYEGPSVLQFGPAMLYDCVPLWVDAICINQVDNEE